LSYIGSCKYQHAIELIMLNLCVQLIPMISLILQFTYAQVRYWEFPLNRDSLITFALQLYPFLIIEYEVINLADTLTTHRFIACTTPNDYFNKPTQYI
jgi:hypothetical protein